MKTYRVAKRRPAFLGALHGVTRREYYPVRALAGISFQLEPGELVGYIGPNGAGKSTTIKILSGILVPDSGECRVLDKVPWRERASYVDHIGVVFGQRSQLINYLPAMAICGKTDPLGLPSWLQWCSPGIGIAFFLVCLLVWGVGVRHYTSTGS